MGIYRHNSIQSKVSQVLVVIMLVVLQTTTLYGNTLNPFLDEADNYSSSLKEEDNYREIYKVINRDYGFVKKLYNIYNIDFPKFKEDVVQEVDFLKSQMAWVNITPAKDLEEFEQSQTKFLNSLHNSSVDIVDNAVDSYLARRARFIEEMDSGNSTSTSSSSVNMDYSLQDLNNKVKELEDMVDTLPTYLEQEEPYVLPIVTFKQIEKSFTTKEPYTVYRVYKGALVLSLFKGTVIEATEDSITLDYGSGVIMKYGNLLELSLRKGDEVDQYNKIGYSGNNISIELILSGKSVDLEKLELPSYINENQSKG